jgi:hypothetical protein
MAGNVTEKQSFLLAGGRKRKAARQGPDGFWQAALRLRYFKILKA